MNILFIAHDPNTFKEDSATHARMKAYAQALNGEYGGTLHILSRALETKTSVYGPLVLHAVAAGKLSIFWKLPTAARQIIDAENIAVVSAQDPFEHGWIARDAVRGTKAKLHVQVHTDFLSPWFTRGVSKAIFLNRIRVHMARRVLVQADGVRVVSERIRFSIKLVFGAKVVEPTVIPIIVDTTVPSAVALPENTFSYSLIAVGRLEAEKHIQDLISVMSLLKDSYPGLGLYIVGEGRMRKELEDLVRAKKLGDRITFLGARTDARGLMKSAGAFIQASAYEGYGLTLVEAALAKIPIITTSVGVVGSVLIPNTHAYVVPVGDVKEMGLRIKDVINDPEKARAIAESSFERVNEYLSHTDSSPRAIITDMARLV